MAGIIGLGFGVRAHFRTSQMEKRVKAFLATPQHEALVTACKIIKRSGTGVSKNDYEILRMALGGESGLVEGLK
jgi:hypothetical protein